ncbi:ABC transporter permease DevC [Merismopedia glauca]|uniref:ABC transporter n=1 Tax=Merismopedia glauca CCAP 1448/3 TaxID=1296344 RepID=A0A2T1CAJ7_9CYAN|nr:ABC transporter permease DevC [Merismopedia glauca]PSB05290.1 ABC transporter [Merismopedia glauca CCAP 1448/3]
MIKTPLAWLQLSRSKSRLLVALAGISFADILMFMQLGFREALFESAVTPHRAMDGDIFLISTQSTALIAMKTFSRRRLYQTLAFDGVASVSPVYLNFGLWKNHVKRNTRGIMVVGFNPGDRVFNTPEINQNLDQIKLPDVVLFDSESREQFGPVGEDFKLGKTISTEVASRRVKVGGIFKMGASFGADGTIVTSDLNFLRIFNRSDPGLIDIGIVKLKPGADVQIVTKNLRDNLPKDVRVFSHEEFMDFEKLYWQEGTAIGFIFTLGTAMGFIVGIVIVYQILSTDVADHLPEYATLKAMGYKQIFLLNIVLQEALILSVLGFIPGTGISILLYGLTKNATSLPIIMTVARATQVLTLTIIMCLISGALAVRKLGAADPADIF